MEDEFNFGDENVADNDMNDSINLDEILLPSGRSDHDTLVKPEKKKATKETFNNLIHIKLQKEPRLKTEGGFVETRGRKSLDQTKAIVGPEKCKVCAATFSSITTLGTHQFKAHNIGGEVCGQCHKVCSTKVALKAHTAIYHRGDLVPCSTCGKTFANKHRLKAHELNSHGKATIPCPDCGKVFPTKLKLRAHEKSFHEERSHACPSCPKIFSVEGNLKSHLKSHEGPSFLCTDCPEGFKRKDSFNRHQYLFHGKCSNIKTFNCDDCGVKLFTKRDFEMHSKQHTGQKDFKCEFCGKLLGRSGSLKNHIRAVHEKVKNFSCNKCDYKAFKKDKFKQHLRKIHDEDLNSHEVDVTDLKMETKCE